MTNPSTRRLVVAWLSANFLAFSALPALAQIRVAAPAGGSSISAVPAASVGASRSSAVTAISPASFSAPVSGFAASAPAFSASAPAGTPGPAAASALAPALVPSAAGRFSAAADSSRPEVPSSPESLAAAAPSTARVSAVSPVSASAARNSRESAAIATIASGAANWTARSAQALDGVPVLAAASQGTSPLDRASARSSAAGAAQETPSPEAPSPSKLKIFLAWAAPILALTALVTGIDEMTKYYAVKHLFHLFHEVAWRKPLIMGLIPYITYTAYKARSVLAVDHTVRSWSILKVFNGHYGLYSSQPMSGMNTMIKDHPSLRWAVRLYDVAIALMIGGMLGNGIDTLRFGGAMDWIPLGRSLMNFADVAVLLGLSYFQASSAFFSRAATAHKAGKPLYQTNAWFLGLPLAGVFIAWAFGSASGGGALDLAMKNVGFLYLMAFSMLIGAGRFVAVAVMNIFVKRFIAEEGVRLAPSEPKA